MKKLLLGLALASATLIACQNPSYNTIGAGAGPEVCPMTGDACEMDKAACEANGACPEAEECEEAMSCCETAPAGEACCAEKN